MARNRADQLKGIAEQAFWVGILLIFFVVLLRVIALLGSTS